MEPVLGVVLALSSELRALAGPARTGPDGTVRLRHPDGIEIRFLQSGIGIDRARDAAVRLAESGASALASFGLSGGLDPGRAPGDLIVAEAVLEDGPSGIETVWSGESSLTKTILGDLGSQGLSAFGGPVVASRRPVPGAEEKSSLRRKSGALAVDMESSGVARAAVEANLPFFCIRAVCDPADRSVPEDLVSLVDSAGRIRFQSVLARLVMNPFRWVRFLESGRDFSAGRRSLRLAWKAEMKTGIPRLLLKRER
jgi:adenosylhomocysteine nucleosidase